MRSVARNETIDGLKYVAAAAIVLLHTAAVSGTSQLAVFLVAAASVALSFFFAVSGFLHGALGGRGASWRLKRLTRLGVPYAFWSVLFLIVGQREWLRGGRPHLPSPLAIIFFAEANGILWFLPMLFACGLISDVFVRSTRSRHVAIVLCAAATLVLVWSGASQMVSSVRWEDFLFAPFWLLSYLGGMEVRASRLLPKTPGRLEPICVLLVAAVGLVAVLAGVQPGPLWTTIKMALWITVPLLILLGSATGVQWFGAARLSWGSDLLIGVYVSHVLWLAMFERMVPRTLPAALWIPAAWAFALAGASVTTWALLSFRLTRPVVV